MCTLTWRHEDPGSYAVFFNRDEQRSRMPARPPRVHRSTSGVAFIAPEDGDFGGTWLGANTFGVTCALLNHYEADRVLPTPSQMLSRGHLVREILGLGSFESCDESLLLLDPVCYRPFHFILFSADQALRHYLWDGLNWLAGSLTNDDRPVTTSSYRTEYVCHTRREAFTALGHNPSTEALLNFHQWRHPDNDAVSVLMQRPEARTVSFSRVTVDPNRITFVYQPEPEHDEDVPITRVDLPRS